MQPHLPPIKAFCAYSHEDEVLLGELRKHLSLLRRTGMIEDWHDRRIMPGEEWSDRISIEFERAEVILLLISASFLSSDYCYGVEMTRAIQRHEEGTARVVPIILRYCDWHDAPFGKLQALPRDGKPVKSWSDVDEGWLDVAKQLRSLVADLIETKTTAAEGEVNASSIPEDDIFEEELGLLDFAVVTEESLGVITETLQRLNGIVSDFGGDMQAKTIEMNRMSSQNNVSYAERKRIAISLAGVLNRFADQLELETSELQTAVTSLGSGAERLVQSASISTEEDKQSATELLLTLENFERSAFVGVAGTRTAKEAMANFRGFESQLNRGASRSVMALENVESTFISLINSTRGIRDILARRIEELDQSDDSELSQ